MINFCNILPLPSHSRLGDWALGSGLVYLFFLSRSSSTLSFSVYIFFLSLSRLVWWMLLRLLLINRWNAFQFFDWFFFDTFCMVLVQARVQARAGGRAFSRAFVCVHMRLIEWLRAIWKKKCMYFWSSYGRMGRWGLLNDTWSTILRRIRKCYLLSLIQSTVKPRNNGCQGTNKSYPL